MIKRKFMKMGMAIFFFMIPLFAFADSVILGPSDFFPISESVLYWSNSQGLYVRSGSQNGHFFAPLHLPDGARITSIVLFYKDSSASGYININLKKRNIYTLDSTTMANQYTSANSSVTPLILKVSPIEGGNKVNNSGYLYFVNIFFGDFSTVDTDCMMYAVKVIYQ